MDYKKLSKIADSQIRDSHITEDGFYVDGDFVGKILEKTEKHIKVEYLDEDGEVKTRIINKEEIEDAQHPSMSSMVEDLRKDLNEIDSSFKVSEEDGRLRIEYPNFLNKENLKEAKKHLKTQYLDKDKLKEDGEDNEGDVKIWYFSKKD